MTFDVLNQVRVQQSHEVGALVLISIWLKKLRLTEFKLLQITEPRRQEWRLTKRTWSHEFLQLLLKLPLATRKGSKSDQ